MDNPQTTPSTDILTQKNYTIREWLMYFKNIWTRNLTARLIDVNTDTAIKNKNPEEMVMCNDREFRTVKERLELGKISVKEAIAIVNSVNELLALSDEEIAKKYSDDALAVAPDMVEKKEEVTSDAPETRGAIDEGQQPATETPVAAVTPEVVPASEVKPENA